MRPCTIASYSLVNRLHLNKDLPQFKIQADITDSTSINIYPDEDIKPKTGKTRCEIWINWNGMCRGYIKVAFNPTHSKVKESFIFTYEYQDVELLVKDICEYYVLGTMPFAMRHFS